MRGFAIVVGVVGSLGSFGWMKVAHADACAKQADVGACYFREGQTLLDGNHPREAAAKFLASYQIDPSKTDPLASHGIALARDNQPVVAAEVLEKAIEAYDARAADVQRTNPNATALVETISQHRAVAAEALAAIEAQIARVEITYAGEPPAGIEVARENPSPLRSSSKTKLVVNPGKDRLVFQLAGKTETVDVTGAAGSTTKIPAPIDALSGTAPKPGPAPIRLPPPRDEPAPSHTRRWIGVGVGVGGLVGLAAGFVLQRKSNATWDDAVQAGCTENPRLECPAGEAANLGNDSNSQAKRALISTIVGGALVATGVVLVLTDRGGKQRSTTATISPTTSGGLLVVGGRF